MTTREAPAGVLVVDGGAGEPVDAGPGQVPLGWAGLLWRVAGQGRDIGDERAIIVSRGGRPRVSLAAVARL